MKTIIRHTFYILHYIALFCLTACEKEIDLSRYHDQQMDETLTLNCIVNPDSVIAASATRPYFYSSTHDDREHVSGLHISVIINGEQTDTMRFDESRHLYLSDTRPQIGDTVTLSTIYCNREVSAQTHIPDTIAIDAVTVDLKGPMLEHDMGGDVYKFYYHITFTDTPDKHNYYFLWIDQRYGTSDYRWEMLTNMNWADEMVFQNMIKDVYNGIGNWDPTSYIGLPFSDRGIDGQAYTLTVEDVVQSWEVDAYYSELFNHFIRRIRLYSITEDYYRYMVSILAQRDDYDILTGGMLQLGIVESRPLHTNVSGGLGFMGGYSVSTRIMDVMSNANVD